MLPTAVLSGLLIVAAFGGRGNKEGAVQAITELEAAGLGVVREERATCGTAKVHLRTLNCMLPDNIVTYLYLYTVYILYMYMCMCIIMKLHPPPKKNKTKQLYRFEKRVVPQDADKKEEICVSPCPDMECC